MRTKITIYRLFVLMVFILTPVFILGADLGNTALERKADRLFIRGYYDRAMTLNQEALTRFTPGTLESIHLHIKMARLYTLLQDTESVIQHYGYVHNTAADSLLTVDDICSYVDALRLQGDIQQAEVVTRVYAYRSPYSRNQRYLNMLHAISNKQHYYNKGDSDYSVNMTNRSTSIPEYWLGKWGGEVFYAVSHSPLQDPLKVFYHRTQYYSYNAPGIEAPLRTIPRELQSGPIAFSSDGHMMVATGIDYRKNDRIKDIYNTRGFFNARIYYSRLNDRRGGWSKPEPLFEYQQGSSYAHPYFFNDDRSLVFSSDRPGGYGGMDLYVCHWNSVEDKWSSPINLGAAVNTEGDEIYPIIRDNQLYFSSNGHEGFGGYDIYWLRFESNAATKGTLFHYPAPTNTASNDFGVFFDGDIAYFISDRRGLEGGDDIYLFDDYLAPLSRDLDVGVSAEHAALTGTLIDNLAFGKGTTRDRNLNIESMYHHSEHGELLLSIHFDFNSYRLDATALSALSAFVDEYGSISGLRLVGYADDFGSEVYNQRLSEQRAKSVSDYLERYSILADRVEGKGKVSLTEEEFMEEAQNLFRVRGLNIGELEQPTLQSLQGLSTEDRIKINRKARRVDIFVK